MDISKIRDDYPDGVVDSSAPVNDKIQPIITEVIAEANVGDECEVRSWDGPSDGSIKKQTMEVKDTNPIKLFCEGAKSTTFTVDQKGQVSIHSKSVDRPIVYIYPSYP